MRNIERARCATRMQAVARGHLVRQRRRRAIADIIATRARENWARLVVVARLHHAKATARAVYRQFLVQQHRDRMRAATSVQRLWRAKRLRRMVALLARKARARRYACAVDIQRVWRGCLHNGVRETPDSLRPRAL